MAAIKFVDLFCGIGGFHMAMSQASYSKGLKSSCVFASDIDVDCQLSYEANFGIRPVGDITEINENEIPDHDILFAGFPCQPFSIMGQMHGFEDTRGTLFFDIARIIKAKRPKAFVLENVKQLKGHDNGRTLQVILDTLKDLGYHVSYDVLNALNHGVPQKRERIIIVGTIEKTKFQFPEIIRKMTPLSAILEKNVDKRYFATEEIRIKRKNSHDSPFKLSIWHENKSGNISSYPFSCALRAGASYNYLLVNGERRLTPREMFRLQGFPDSYKIIGNDSVSRRQTGNAVPVPLVRDVIDQLLDVLFIKTEPAVIYHNEEHL